MCTRGYLDGDGDRDLFDILRLVDIILDRPPPPNPDEVYAADLDDDEDYDLFDLMAEVDCVIDKGSGSVCPATCTPTPMDTDTPRDTDTPTDTPPGCDCWVCLYGCYILDTTYSTTIDKCRKPTRYDQTGTVTYSLPYWHCCGAGGPNWGKLWIRAALDSKWTQPAKIVPGNCTVKRGTATLSGSQLNDYLVAYTFQYSLPSACSISITHHDIHINGRCFKHIFRPCDYSGVSDKTYESVTYKWKLWGCYWTFLIN